MIYPLILRWLSMMTVVYLLPYFSPVFAQQQVAPVARFGVITPAWFNRPVADSTAEAVVQHMAGQVRFDISGGQIWMVFDKHVRIQIRRQSAYSRATITLPMRHVSGGQSEYMANLEGNTYNLAQGVVTTDKLTKAGRFSEKASENYVLEKFTMPNVREGSIIDYRYTVRTPFSANTNPDTWYFQHDIPVAWSEYNITIPACFYYKMVMSGYLSLLINEKKNITVSFFESGDQETAVSYRFALKNAPAFRDEAYITTRQDYLSKIDFELASYTLPGATTKNVSVGWDATDHTLLNHEEFGRQFRRASFLQETARQLRSQCTDTLSCVQAACSFVQRQMKWNGEFSYWSENLKKAYENKKGNAADINLLLVALLREMNFACNPVILSTRSHGRIDETYALATKFNYVVAHLSLGGHDMLLDATDPYLKPGTLPFHCLNEVGRLIHPQQARFIKITPNERDVESKTAVFTLSSDGQVSGTLVHEHGGYSALSARKSFMAEGRNAYQQQIQKKRPAWQIDKAVYSGANEKTGVFAAAYTLTIPEALSGAGERLYLLPMLTEALSANPFKETERDYPVDFGVNINETFLGTYTLPDGFEVEELPKPAIINLPDNGGRFTYQVSHSKTNQLQLVSRIMIHKTRFYANEYPALREFFSRIVGKHAEQVVLKRSPTTPKK